MFFRVKVDDDRRPVRIEIDGREVICRAGDTVAAAVLLDGSAPYRRSILSGEARAPFCMMGVCFDCLAVVNGQGSVQTCLVTVEDNMHVERQMGRRSLNK